MLSTISCILSHTLSIFLSTHIVMQDFFRLRPYVKIPAIIPIIAIGTTALSISKASFWAVLLHHLLQIYFFSIITPGALPLLVLLFPFFVVNKSNSLQVITGNFKIYFINSFILFIGDLFLTE